MTNVETNLINQYRILSVRLELFSLVAEGNRGPLETPISDNAEKMRNITMNKIYSLVDDYPLTLNFTW